MLLLWATPALNCYRQVLPREPRRYRRSLSYLVRKACLFQESHFPVFVLIVGACANAGFLVLEVLGELFVSAGVARRTNGSGLAS